MSYDDYWNGPAELTRYYYRAYEIKRDRKNEELWLQGMYIYEALCNVSPLMNALAKDHKPIRYPEKPYPITKEEIAKREEEKQEESMDSGINYMETFKNAFNKKLKSKKG